MRCLAFIVALSAASASAAAVPAGSCPGWDRLAPLEAAIAHEPEDLRIAADYRQIVIACGDYDRSTRLFEGLAKQKGSGPHVKISLALAYVDKVPVSGDIRRLYLARDAMSALTKAIATEPSVLAYYTRGRINLYFNNFIFKRARIGVTDLHAALALVTPATPPALAERVWVSLGEGYWRAENRPRAREIWRIGAEQFPESADLALRLAADDESAAAIVGHSLNDSTRVDTTLRGLLPER
jgi:hypothetical protein